MRHVAKFRSKADCGIKRVMSHTPMLIVRMLLTSTALTAVVSLPGCNPVQTNYLGNSYAPTKEIDVYFVREDIERPYRVMGIAELVATDGTKTSRYFKSIVTTAQKHGADAVLVQGMNREAVGSASGGGGGGAKWNEWPMSVRVHGGGGATKAILERVVRAQFLKYKPSE